MHARVRRINQAAPRTEHERSGTVVDERADHNNIAKVGREGDQIHKVRQ